MSLVSKVELSDEDQMVMFVEGLKPCNKKLITILGPKNLLWAIAYAKTLTAETDPYGDKRHEGVGEMRRRLIICKGRETCEVFQQQGSLGKVACSQVVEPS